MRVLVCFACVLALLVPLRAHAWFENLVPASVAATEPEISATTFDYLTKLHELMKAEQDHQKTDVKNGGSDPADHLVRMRLRALEDADSPIASLSLAPDLHKEILAEITKHKLREKESEPRKEPSAGEIAKLFTKGALSLSRQQALTLAAIAQLENERRLKGKTVGDAKELLREIAIDSLKILSKDLTSEKLLEIPADLKKELVRHFLSHFKEKDPGEAKKVEKQQGLTAAQLSKLLQEDPKAGEAFRPEDWLALNSHLGGHAIAANGPAFRWSILRDHYENLAHGERLRNPSAKPPSFGELLKHFANFIKKQTPARPDPGPGKLSKLGEGPPIGQPGDPAVFPPNPTPFERPRTSQDWENIGIPTTDATFTPEQKKLLKAARLAGLAAGMIALSFAGDPGTFHCGIGWISKDPEYEALHPLHDPDDPTKCIKHGAGVAHCFTHGTLIGATISGLSQVFSARIDIQKGGSKNADGALFTVSGNCDEIQKLPTSRLLSKVEAQQLYANNQQVPVAMGRNCWINSNRAAHDRCVLYGQTNLRGPSDNFVTFNSSVHDYHDDFYNQETTEQGDSGSPLETPVKNPRTGQIEMAYLASVSNVLVNGPLGPGRVGGAAYMLDFLDKLLPGKAMVPKPDYSNAVTFGNDINGNKGDHTL